MIGNLSPYSIGYPRVADDGTVYLWCPNPADGTRCTNEACIKIGKCQKRVHCRRSPPPVALEIGR